MNSVVDLPGVCSTTLRSTERVDELRCCGNSETSNDHSGERVLLPLGLQLVNHLIPFSNGLFIIGIVEYTETKAKILVSGL